MFQNDAHHTVEVDIVGDGPLLFASLPCFNAVSLQQRKCSLQMKRNARLRNSAKLHQEFFFGREPKLHGVSQAAVGLGNKQEFADIYNEKNGVA